MTRRYYHDEIGWNSRLDSLQAAILEVKLRYLPKWNQQRRALAVRYDELFGKANLVADRNVLKQPLAVACQQLVGLPGHLGAIQPKDRTGV